MSIQPQPHTDPIGNTDIEEVRKQTDQANSPPPRSGSRARKLSDKGKELREQELKRQTKAFLKAYAVWKEKAKSARSSLKDFCDEGSLTSLSESVRSGHDRAFNVYDIIRKSGTVSQDIVRKMDVCGVLTNEIVEIVSKRVPVQEKFDRVLEKERVRIILDKAEHCSIFGESITETEISHRDNEIKESGTPDAEISHRGNEIEESGPPDAGSETNSGGSRSSLASSKRVDAEAELAASVEHARAIKEIQQQEARLAKVQSEWKVREAEMFTELRKREVEMQALVAAENTKLQKLHAERELNMAAARVKTYEASIEDGRRRSPAVSVINSGREQRFDVGGSCSSGYHPPSQEAASIAHVIASALGASRLPIPEPVVFSGDPLKYVDFKISFAALIDRKPLPVAEKMYYLRRYLSGEARRAVEGFFFQESDQAYKGALGVLEQRYGDPFILKKAFRDKLNSWPKIGPRDAHALRDFSDFLQGCLGAIPHVRGLNILSDCEENHKLLKKLPEWLARNWNRIVVETLDKTGDYPDFACFAKFLGKEARIACNPVSSPLLAEKPVRSAKTLTTATFPRPSLSRPSRTQRERSPLSLRPPVSQSGPLPGERPPCPFCNAADHGVATCSTFAARPGAEKRAFVREGRLCFGCLRRGHMVGDCKRRHTCRVCNGRHPTSLHEERERASYTQPKGPSKETAQNTVAAVSHAASRNTSTTSSIVPVFLSTTDEPERETLVYALLDTQSDTTFVLQDALNDLVTEANPVNLKLSTMTAVDSIIQSERVSKLRVRGFRSDRYLQLPDCYTRDFIPVDRAHIPTPATALQWPHLKHLACSIPPIQDCEVGLLIGYDCPAALAPLETIVGAEAEPFAQKTELGWSIIGRTNPHLDREGSCGYVHRLSTREIAPPSQRDVLRALESDFHEQHYEEKYVSQEDMYFIEHLSNNIRKGDTGHYEMPLPFKQPGPPLLPNNYKLAAIRLEHLKRKLLTDEKLREQYSVYMREIIERGDAELAPRAEDGDVVWYIPHHGVYHKQKPGKLRVVFDCSAKFAGVSLNENLLTGPDLTNRLVGVLCRFRKNQVAVVCDVEKMFHQFHVTPEGRDYLRFLWWEDGDLTRKPREYRMTVHLFGASSSPSCANFGLRYLARQNQNESPSAASFIERNFYVDDGLTSVASVDEAKNLIRETKELCRRGGMRLHKFVSNKREVVLAVEEKDRGMTEEGKDLAPGSQPAERALGIQWSVEKDTFCFHITAPDRSFTRRSVLSVIASLYDPLGFVSPFVLRGKLILKELCQRGANWDEPLPEDIAPRWEHWLGELSSLRHITIPRCYCPPDLDRIVTTELHHFSDASTLGYGACLYLRFKDEEGNVHCSLVLAKSRVAPSKVMSIPRMELSGALVAARLGILLRNELDSRIDREFFWTDSQVVLGYISNEARRFHIFVANRVQMIRDTTSPDDWHYVNTLENPADHTSRGLVSAELGASNWFTGPEFLWQRELEPPQKSPGDLLVGDPEVRAIQVMRTVTYRQDAADCQDILSRFDRFSSWTTVLRVVARIHGFGRGSGSGTLSVDDLQTAATSVVRLMQRAAFPDEMRALEGKGCVASSGQLFDLDPFVKIGLLRVGGRLRQSTLPESVRHPLILPKGGHLTNLIVAHYHVNICHQGRNQTLNELRANGFYVVGGTKAVARHIQDCVLCRRLRKPVCEQQMADLPVERVETSPPFTHSGMDCFGPFIVKKARKEHKRYGLIFTCLCSRAVHIEMVEDLTTDAFINALRCFISIRGAVSQLYCDQGSNFVGASNELREALKECDMERAQEFLSKNQCQFAFNAPASSHAGGIWERQIRTIRSVLDATLSLCPGRLDDSSLRTLFYEAMSIVNSRPLTVNGIGDPTILEPLTPNHILTMKSRVALPPPGKFVKEDMYIAKRWRRVQYLIEQFWSRWRREYLANISLRTKWHSKRRNLRVNDVVLVKDESLHRSQWSLPRVIETMPGRDGLVRRVRVRLGDRSGGACRKAGQGVVERPIQKLVLLVEAR